MMPALLKMLIDRISIESIPPEVLSCVFHAVQDVVGWPGPASRPLQWIQLSWVCRRWRQIALSDHTLWIHIRPIDIRILNWLPTSLQRAQGAPLYLYLDAFTLLNLGANEPEYVKIMEVIFHHADTIRCLHLSTSLTRNVAPAATRHVLQTVIRETISPQFTRMHSLESFIVVATPYGHSKLELGAAHQHLPRLRTLRLVDVSLPWTSALYTSLRELCIHRRSRKALSAESLFQTLHACPNLEVLSLENSWGVSTSIATTPVVDRLCPVTLPKLKLLRLRDRPGRVAFLCARIVVGAHCAIAVTHLDDMLSLARLAPRQKVYRATLAAARRVDIVLDDPGLGSPKVLRFATCTHPNDPPVIGPGGWEAAGLRHLPPGSVVVDADRLLRPACFARKEWRKVLQAFLKASADAPGGGGVPQVTELRMVCDALPSVSANTWAACFATFSRLEKLVVGPCHVPVPTLEDSSSCGVFDHVLKALAIVCDDSSERDGRGELLVPGLRKLELERIVFTQESLEALLKVIRIREEAGAHLEELVLREAETEGDSMGMCRVLGELALEGFGLRVTVTPQV